MTTYKKRPDFFSTTEGKEFIATLTSMAADDKYNTGSTYSANSELYPDNLIPFVNKHVEYITKHPATNPEHYLSNLRLMTRVR